MGGYPLARKEVLIGAKEPKAGEPTRGPPELANHALEAGFCAPADVRHAELFAV
jgi:hypothetical protein